MEKIRNMPYAILAKEHYMLKKVTPNSLPSNSTFNMLLFSQLNHVSPIVTQF